MILVSVALCVKALPGNEVSFKNSSRCILRTIFFIRGANRERIRGPPSIAAPSTRHLSQVYIPPREKATACRGLIL